MRLSLRKPHDRDMVGKRANALSLEATVSRFFPEHRSAVQLLARQRLVPE